MGTKETRNESYLKTKTSPSYKIRKQVIIQLLKLYPYGLTAREIAEKLKLLERNNTAPRLSELMKEKKVAIRKEKRYDKKTDRNVTVYILPIYLERIEKAMIKVLIKSKGKDLVEDVKRELEVLSTDQSEDTSNSTK